MWSRLSAAKTTTTPGDRADDMRRAAAAFSAHLASSPGAVLSPRLRLGVAVRARDALLKFEGDDGDACPLGLYSYVAGTVRAPFPAPSALPSAAPSVARVALRANTTVGVSGLTADDWGEAEEATFLEAR